jgi:signal transduction histidine kinase/ActR/RegA family two-component response regulator
MVAWRELWSCPPLESDQGSERRRTAHTLLRAGTVISAVGLVLSIVIDPRSLVTHGAYAGVLVVHVLTLALLRRSLPAAIVTFAVLYLAVVFAALWRFGGIRAPAGFVLPPVVLFVGLTLSGRAAVLTAIVASLELVALVVLEQRGVLPAMGRAPPERLALVAMTTLVITGLMLAAALDVIRASRARAAAEEQARRGLEERLLQSRRMEAVGRLAAGVAHDFNNLLTVVFAEATRLRRDEKNARSAASIASAAERAAALTRQLLTFGRRQVREPEVLEVNAVIEHLRKLLGSFLGEDVRLELALTPDTGRVRADRTELEQVLLNLVTNARDAMPGGGTITIRTGRAADGAVVLEVVDTGTGIAPDAQAHLFEPFFTTKEVGKGTGLGLATVRDIVSRAGGAIQVTSGVGNGTRITVTLPAVEAPAPVAAPPPARVTPAGAPSIVVVDDDPLVRSAIQAVLADAGYAARAVRSPGELLEEAAGWQRAPDLILTDVVMHEIAGPELVRRLRARFPDLRALFMSGHAEERLSERGVIAPGVHFVAKPLEQAALLDKVAQVLASQNPGALGPAA